MDLQASQYQSALRLAQGAEDALQQLMTRLKKHDEPTRIRRAIEDVESLLKKVKRELRV
jgi:ppGpp synthetase/RelA/SpoT-type nucleotidyltranferase